MAAASVIARVVLHGARSLQRPALHLAAVAVSTSTHSETSLLHQVVVGKGNACVRTGTASAISAAPASERSEPCSHKQILGRCESGGDCTSVLTVSGAIMPPATPTTA